jgi:enoyl-CoA hydratase/carnithine racemase
MTPGAAQGTVATGTGRIVADVHDGIGWITFNHAQRRNAMSLDMWDGLGLAAEAFQRDPSVRAVVMRGAGGQAFVSGADISEFEAHRANASQKRSYDEVAARGHAGLANLDKPLIALIEGFCVGGGLAIALAADVRFATAGSRLAIPAARLGLGYDYRGLAALARLVGPSVAKDMLFSGRFIEAEEALRLGLVNFVVDAAQVEARVRDYAARVAANAPLTVRAAKAAVRLFEQGVGAADAAELAAVDTLVMRCFDSQDYEEGRRAFLDKRTPRFQGL